MDKPIRTHEETVQAIRELLRGKGPELQGSILAELTATWQAGHHPALRPVVLSQWIGLVQDLIPICEKEIFGVSPVPQSVWDERRRQ